MSTQSLAPARRDWLRPIRSQTLQLFDLVTSEDVLRTEPMPGFRPLLWHLAHIGVYQNYWVLQKCAGQASINPKYDIHFDPIKTPREEATVLPSRAEIEAYDARTLELVEQFLENADRDTDATFGLHPDYALDLVIQHELQHQETIAFVLQALPLDRKRQRQAPPLGQRAATPGEVAVPALDVMIGGDERGFVYDNELPRHAVHVPPFLIDRDLTTNAEYAEFIERGGYKDRALWSDDGWAWLTSTGASAPLYWSAAPWRERTFFDERPLREDAPVTGVSWFEAEAYAKFRGKRLPTETEWEAAAGWDPARESMRRFPWGDESTTPAASPRRIWGTVPVGSAQMSALGVADVTGNLWQWTSSDFRGYPGFEAYPYPEYSQEWFDGDHRVSRGGSWYTDPSLGRVSFRNFYRRHFRPAFLGIRCARDAR
jgi:gamma-glutamyl hercynylcysteine S-oxide synthase